ncbi:MAG: hypothetical protein ABI696_06680, partial [Rubrivivax sp.]
MASNCSAGDHHDDSDRFTTQRAWLATRVEDCPGSHAIGRRAGDAAQAPWHLQTIEQEQEGNTMKTSVIEVHAMLAVLSVD